MQARRTPVKALFAVASIAILALFISSDFSPPSISGFLEAQSMSEEVEVRCIILSCNNSSKGYVLELMDAQGTCVRAYCPREILNGTPPSGSVIDIICQASSDDRSFFFIRSLYSPSAEVGLTTPAALRASCSWP